MKLLKIQQRIYLLTFLSSGHTYPLCSDDAQRLIDEYPIVKASPNRIVLAGHNTDDPKQRCILQPASLGGGPAFQWEGE